MFFQVSNVNEIFDNLYIHLFETNIPTEPTKHMAGNIYEKSGLDSTCTASKKPG